MKHSILALLAYSAAALAQSWDHDNLYARAAIADMDGVFEEDTLWTRDAEADFEDWMDDLLEARDAEPNQDGDDSIHVEFLWSRDAKKSSPAPKDDWTAPKVNIPAGDKVTKNTFKCNSKKHQCSGEIDLQIPKK